MDRRTFVSTAVGVLLVKAFPANAQPAAKVPRIGFLSSTPSGISEGFRERLKELGRIEGRNIIVEWRWTEGKAERSSGLAAELVRLAPDLIVTTSGQPTAAVNAATATIPIVFVSVGDPVGTGLVASLARPGGNVTGLAALAAEGFTGKMFELLKVAIPQASRVAILMNPTSADHRQVVSPELPAVAEQLRLTIFPIEVQAAQELDAAFERATRPGPTPSWCWGIRWCTSTECESRSWLRSNVCRRCISSVRASRPED